MMETKNLNQTLHLNKKTEILLFISIIFSLRKTWCDLLPTNGDSSELSGEQLELSMCTRTIPIPKTSPNPNQLKGMFGNASSSL